MNLCLGAAMLHPAQQLGIHSRQPCQRSCINAIIFAPTLPDQAYVPCMRDNHLAPQCLQQPADPRRVRPVSRAIRLRRILPNTCFLASGVVVSRVPKGGFNGSSQHRIKIW